MANIGEIIKNLSGGIKAREDGLASLRRVFSQDNAVKRFSRKEHAKDRSAWSAVFQALFELVGTERKLATTAAAKKSKAKSGPSTSTATVRLSAATSTIRWLTERALPYMDKKLVDELLRHVIQTLPTTQRMDAVLSLPVALDMAKTIKCLASHIPHIENMKDDMWVTIVEFSFNAVLGDPIHNSFAFKEPTTVSDDSDMYDDDEQEADFEEYEDSSDARTSNKRKRLDRTPTPLPSPKKGKSRVKSGLDPTTVSQEQLEFMSLLSVMIPSPSTPMLVGTYENLVPGILRRLERFLELYPNESSLLHDYLHVVSATIRQISLNNVYEMQCFARTTWPRLVGLWGVKEKSIKEELTVILRRLFQFIVSPSYINAKLPSFDCSRELERLWTVLDADLESRWGVEKLSLDALSLKFLASEQTRSANTQAFVAKTFRAGWNFNAGQALSWALLELKADCAGKLLMFSESMESTVFTSSSRTNAKRIKLSDPISALLISVQESKPQNKIYHLQTLLFFIDRHWEEVHDSLKDRVVTVLLQYLGFDDPGVQSWVFLNLAAIVYSEGTRMDAPSPVPDDRINPDVWDVIWTHAMRRANVPLICRAACHAGQAILCTTRSQGSTPSRIRIDSQRILQEIENFTKDINLQGPAYPFDSVCDFLSQCLSIANQDARLYRMRFEDRVLTWFTDAWDIASNKQEIASYTVQDIMFLLETICALPKQADLVIRPLLPQSEVVDNAEEESELRIVQNFTLYAKLPPFRTWKGGSSGPVDETGLTANERIERSQSYAPSGREIKVCTFLLKATETLILNWESQYTYPSVPPIEVTRRILDVVVVSLTFESLLTLNGTTSNRQLLQNCSKLIFKATQALLTPRWTTSEKLIVFQSLEAIVNDEYIENRRSFKDALVDPGAWSGIKAQILQDLLSSGIEDRKTKRSSRLNLLRALWQNPELQEALKNIIATAKQSLLQLLGISNKDYSGEPMDVDNDGFEPIRINDPQSSALTGDADRAHHHLYQICVGFLACGPFFQSSSGEPTRDKQVIDLVISAIDRIDVNPDRFFLLCSVFFERVRQGMLRVSQKSFKNFLTALEPLLRDHRFSKSGKTFQLCLDVLESCLDIWQTDSELNAQVRALCTWLSQVYDGGRMRPWTIRDSFARFMDKHLAKGFPEESWLNKTDKEELLPQPLLLRMNKDPDIRVRFRAATIHCHLFSLTELDDLMALYESVCLSLTKEIDDFEDMLTRMLTLANIVIRSSAMRRGAYWHLLEASLYSESYAAHIQAMLNGISRRLGLSSLSSLFQAYASQLAFSIANHEKIHDFIGFPPHLLGYKDKKQCAQAVFQAFTPTNVLAGKGKLFESHCRVLQISPTNGLIECFGDIIGFQVTYYVNKSMEFEEDALYQHIKDKFPEIEDYDGVFMHNVDRITVQVLRSLGDQDSSEDGPIMNALKSFDPSGKMASDFQSLTCFRAADKMKTHAPNLPAFATATILHCLSWLHNRAAEAYTNATIYHVVQELLDNVHQTPLVNEQIRLVNALCLCLAYYQHDTNDAILMQAIVHGATLILSQSDLARSAQSILDWAFRIYRKGNIADSGLPNTLIRICSVSHDYIQNKHDPSVAKLGKELAEWIDREAYALSKTAILKRHVLRALPAWPQQPSSELLPLYHQSTISDLSSILSDQRIKSNKFRLVRKFLLHGAEKDYDDIDERFAKDYFWRFKDCMPPAHLLLDEDVQAFADLLLLHHGRIGSFGIEKLSLTRGPLAKGTEKAPRSPYNARDAITFALLKMLDSDDSSQVFKAYHTLRQVVAVPALVSVQDNTGPQLPSEYRAILDYVKAHPRTARQAIPTDIHESLLMDQYVDSAVDFSKWITSVSELFTNVLGGVDPFFGQLSSILSSDPTFAEQVLPILVHQLLLQSAASKKDFKSLQDLITTFFTKILQFEGADLPCIRSVVDTVLYLRSYMPPQKQTVDYLAYNKWLKVDYFLLAASAIKCGAYTTAVLFVELGWESLPDGEDAPNSEDVLYEIYAHIDEPDGFYGIKPKDLQRFLVKRFQHEQQWDKAFRFHGAALEADPARGRDRDGLVRSFHSFGFSHLALDTLKDAESSNSVSSINYSLGWRTETWDLPDQTQAEPSSSLYRSLRAVYRERDARVLRATIRSSMLREMGCLRDLKSENVAQVRIVCRDLMCLSQIMSWRKDLASGALDKKEEAADRWARLADIDPQFEFSDLESVMATRIALVRSVRQKEERQQIGNMTTPFIVGLKNIEKRCLIRLSEAARIAGQTQIALNSVLRAQHLDVTPSSEIAEEFANVLWIQNEEKAAVQYLQAVIKNMPTVLGADASYFLRKALLLARLGTWTSDACLQKPAEIWEKYFSPAISILEHVDIPAQDDTSQATVYRECALFAERQFHAISKSTDAARWKVYTERKKQEIEDRKKAMEQARTPEAHKDLQSEQSRAQKLLNEDIESFRIHNLLREKFLQQALEMHSSCLKTSDKFDNDSAIRFVSLWFANFYDFQESEVVGKSISSGTKTTPSRKFIFLAHQLTARVTSVAPNRNRPDKNQEKLYELVRRMCMEHPFHIFYQLYCLSDREVEPTHTRRSHSFSQTTPTDRSRTAIAIIDQLRTHPTSGPRINVMEKVCDAYLEWAKYKIKGTALGNQKGAANMPPQLKLGNIRRIIRDVRIPVATVRILVDPTLLYENCVWIEDYEKMFKTAGGVNLPKINICKAVDGSSHRQLFKGEGNDDLRQDAVMAQVFDLVNNILKSDRETRRRELRVRDYKVIPLASQAGMLEFVDNTIPMRNWLGKAHQMYRPKDIVFNEALTRLRNVQTSYKRNHARQLAVYEEILQEFHPVMRHFFTEKHKVPMSWFRMRLNYTRSIATTSIVGHVLGIGDRHASNILLDNETGEVVHIDFGIAFDQGKLLPVPEKVPFRMTRDIVDGMGVSGTSGVFQRCAEETLRVLREESDLIMTVLEVFRHDPLHSWTASEVKVQQAQGENAGTTGQPPGLMLMTTTMNNLEGATYLPFGFNININSTAEEAADRALTSVLRKLDKSLSVESTVNELVAEATDHMNLATIYSGWGPFS
ncbi:hypothetical protein CPC08DRAFT_815090 [Agrocybe pediades]|nr:hypothetical protein CPC08DRAFT_815090 [Agrocybe pediades]